MTGFAWRGRLPASKSILNRLFILRSFQPGLNVLGESSCDDVVAMRSGLAALQAGERTLSCGSAGTVLRFLAARVSREPGVWHLTGAPRLFARPQEGLRTALAQLGVDCASSATGLTIRSEQGWRAPPRPVRVDRSASSQFASGLLLASCALPFDLEFEWMGDAVSDGYLQMTERACADHGIVIERRPNGAFLPRAQRPAAGVAHADCDVSSAFAVGALGALGGRAEILDFPFLGGQPDLAFVAFLSAMGARAESVGGDLLIERPSSLALRALNANLVNCPDLFPVLAVVCAFAEGVSRLHGAPHLAHKESSRIEATARLLRLLGADCRVLHGGLEIEGLGGRAGRAETAPYDPEDDHRLAMAAAAASLAREVRGAAPLRIERRDVVSKSYPEFWRDFEAGRTIVGTARA